MSEVSKLYVGNLDYKITEDELKSHFEGSGIQTKTVTLIKDKYTGQAKGFGFVEVESEEVIQKAVEALDGQEFKGRKLTVNKAKPMKDRSSGGNGGFRGDRGPRY